MMQACLVAVIKAYRYWLSPWLGSSCRFEPSCSVYALTSLQSHGAAKGLLLLSRRLMRCQPFCQGGHDPVPVFFSWAKQPTPVCAEPVPASPIKPKQSP